MTSTAATPANTADAWRVLTELDDARLRRMRTQHPLPPALDEQLEDVLTQSDLISSRQVGADVVTMHSRLRVRNPHDQSVHTLTLSYPTEANVDTGRISVLSPMGLALIGHRVGQTAEGTMPDGRHQSWLIEALEYQPEANGHFDL